ncbi:transposase [Undibacterium squillarum]|uniref:transposase n=1 Tax=Undibacterium squillarum TaxID=1131567 RepID=UPI0027E4421E|nr:transposase [Undibacterium squillarum]
MAIRRRKLRQSSPVCGWSSDWRGACHWQIAKGGVTTKIHVAADAHENPVDFEIAGGEVQYAKAARKLIGMLKAAQHTIADEGYDAQVIREHIGPKGAIPLISRKSNSRKAKSEFGAHL